MKLSFVSALFCLASTASTVAAFQPIHTHNNEATRWRTTPQETKLYAESTATETFTKQETSKTDNPRKQGLALMLDDGTRKSHSMAQNTAFVTGFFKGLSTRESYKALLTSLYFVYQAMESSFENTNDSNVQTLDDPELRRLKALQTDMEYFYDRNATPTLVASPATRAYVARIQEVAQTKPYLFIAHQYTRYLGDLFGGQMMGGMASSSLDLPTDGRGVAFYTFDEISDTTDFITHWYQRLNDLDLTETQKQEIVDEANLVFDLNIDILQEVEGSPLQAIWSMAIRSIRERLGQL